MNDFIKGVFTGAFMLSIFCTVLMAVTVKKEVEKWKSACAELGIVIRWHEMSIDGVTTNWVELVELRDDSARRAK